MWPFKIWHISLLSIMFLILVHVVARIKILILLVAEQYSSERILLVNSPTSEYLGCFCFAQSQFMLLWRVLIQVVVYICVSISLGCTPKGRTVTHMVIACLTL